MKRFLSLFDPLRYVGRPEYFVIFLITACVEIGLCFLIAKTSCKESLDNITLSLMFLSLVLFVPFGCAVWGRLRSIDKTVIFPLIFCIFLILYNCLLELFAHYCNIGYLSLRNWYWYPYIESVIFILSFIVIGVIKPGNCEEKPNKYKLRLKRIVFNPLIILLNILYFYFISMCMASMGYEIIIYLILFVYIVSSLFLIFCRLQDINISGWWCFLFALLPVTVFYHLVFLGNTLIILFMLISILSPVLLMFGKSVNEEEKPANLDDNKY